MARNDAERHASSALMGVPVSDGLRCCAHRRLVEPIAQVGFQALCQLSRAAHHAQGIRIAHMKLCQLLQLLHRQPAWRALPRGACWLLRLLLLLPLLLLILLLFKARLPRIRSLLQGARGCVGRPRSAIHCLPPSRCLLF